MLCFLSAQGPDHSEISPPISIKQRPLDRCFEFNWSQGRQPCDQGRVSASSLQAFKNSCQPSYTTGHATRGDEEEKNPASQPTQRRSFGACNLDAGLGRGWTPSTLAPHGCFDEDGFPAAKRWCRTEPLLTPLLSPLRQSKTLVTRLSTARDCSRQVPEYLDVFYNSQYEPGFLACCRLAAEDTISAARRVTNFVRICDCLHARSASLMFVVG